MTIGLSSPSLDTLVETRVETGKAIDFHYQSMEISEASGDKQGIVNSLGGLSNAYYSLGNHQKAIDFHAQHNELAQAIGYKQGIAGSFFNLGNALGRIDEHFNALQCTSELH